MKSKFPDCRIPEIEKPEDVFDVILNVFRNRFGDGRDPVPRAWLTDSEIFETIRETKEKYIERKGEKRIEGENDCNYRPDGADSDRDAGGAENRGWDVGDATSQDK